MATKKKTAKAKTGAAVPAGAIERLKISAEDPATPEIIPIETGGFPVVGIGASAGGLSAFESFFSGMPADADPGMAFVLVQHLAPDHKSILTELIRRYTRMQVFEVEDGMTVAPNCAYIIPPNRDMAFMGGALHLLQPDSPRGQRMPIDYFFRSLAQDQRERAICIVLSGTGSDGTLGLRAIKGEGGMAMAQDPATTEYDGMPRSAIATGLVDFQLPPAEMPSQLMVYVSHAVGKPPLPAASPRPRAENAMKKICVVLRAQTGHDFSLYKPSTLHRRIERRMAVHQLDAMDGYVRFLQQTPAEVEALFRDLLIGVTSFFRDLEAFEALDEQVVARLLANKPAGSTIRVWAPGCSSGEEAYSMAILLAERQETLKRSFTAQVFATDIDALAIATARTGIYPASIAADVSRERLERFFSVEPGGGAYRIHKSIRDMLVFSEQDVIRDPPFSGIDLISCRNLLIYMGQELQKKLIPLFHYALNPGGFLFLGTSETVGDFGDLFATLDRKAKLYRRKETVTELNRVPLGKFLPPMTEDEEGLPRRKGQAAGAARPTLRDLTAVLHDVTTSGVPVRRPSLRVKTNGDFTLLNLAIRPVAIGPAGSPEAPVYLVVLETAAEVAPGPTPQVRALTEVGDGTGAATDVDARIAALQHELRAKEEYLHTANEELETSNEELKSSNEEMQSVNEELQSTNEELETSKEELQSVNEELATVNAELQNKVSDLSRANNDMNNLLAGTGIATVFVDYQLRILRFTPTATQVINLIQSDIGRPVAHIVSNLKDYSALVADARTVLDTLMPKALEVQTVEGIWFSMRIQPYRTMENVIEGAVITFVDITEHRRADENLRASEERFRSVRDNSFERFTILRPICDDHGEVVDFTYLYQNAAAARLAGRRPEELVGRRVTEFWPTFPRTRSFEIYKQVAETSQGTTFEDRYDADGLDEWFRAIVSPIPEGVAVATQIITDRKRTEAALRESENLVREVLANFPKSSVSVIEPDLTIGFTSGQEFKKLEEVFGEQTPFVRENYLRAFEGEEVRFELFINNRRQSHRIIPLPDTQGRNTRLLAVVEDITDQPPEKGEGDRR